VRIIYLHQYFTTPDHVGGIRSYEMARRLVAKGHDVQMITTYNRPTDKTSWFETTEEGIRVHWLPMPWSNRQSNAERIQVFFRFAYGAARRAMAIDGDVVFATSTPLTIAIPGVLAARRKGVPMVFEVRDLWPEAPVQMGALKSPNAIRAAKALEHLAYRNARHVVALSPGMAEGVIRAGVPRERVSVIPNASDLDLFRPDLDGTDFRRKFGLEGKTVFIYFGTMGPANGLGFVLDGAAELKRRGREDLAFILHGDGKERPLLEARKQQEGLDNVIFSDWDMHREDLARLVASADVAMTIYKNVPILYTCSPNKMFDAFSAGKPVLTNMPGWLQSLVEEHEAGVFVRPDDAADFADKAAALAGDRERIERYGRNARQLAEREFSRDLLADKLEAVLLKAAGRA
jgi:glycosyltransferase involved in cell wall biosynthesis